MEEDIKKVKENLNKLIHENKFLFFHNGTMNIEIDGHIFKVEIDMNMIKNIELIKNDNTK